jgi:hypothetical protein
LKATSRLHRRSRFIAARNGIHLYSNFNLRRPQPGAAIFHAETHISTQPTPPVENARLSPAHEDKEWTRSAVAPPGERTQASFGEAGLPRITPIRCRQNVDPDLNASKRKL